MANAEIERAAIEYVMELERKAGRQPVDVHLQGFPYDVSSPPRKIEIKAFGGSARGAPIPLEDRQAKAAREDRETFFVYVVDNIAEDQAKIAVRVLRGPVLREMLDRAAPHITYWPTHLPRSSTPRSSLQRMPVQISHEGSQRSNPLTSTHL